MNQIPYCFGHARSSPSIPFQLGSDLDCMVAKICITNLGCGGGAFSVSNNSRAVNVSTSKIEGYLNNCASFSTTDFSCTFIFFDNSTLLPGNLTPYVSSKNNRFTALASDKNNPTSFDVWAPPPSAIT